MHHAVLSYVQQLASQTGTDISAWDMTKFDHFAATDKREINKAFFSYEKPISVTEAFKLPPEIDQQIQAQIERFKLHRIQDLESNYRSHISNCEDYYRGYEERMGRAMRARIELQMLNGNPMNTIKEELDKVFASNFFKYSSFSNSKLVFTTINDCVVTERNPNIDLRRTVNLGKYMITVDIGHGEMRVQKYENNITTRNGYYHPYVSNSGTICWGNANETVIPLIAEKKYGEIFSILSSLLTNYCDSTTPYENLADFAKLAEQGVTDAEDSNDCPCCGNDMDGDCDCYTCSECDHRDDYSHCERHWCEVCETDNRRRCECCRQCERTGGDCVCCSICSGSSEECDCCNTCDSTADDCTCCPICGSSDKDSCGCCTECDRVESRCVCEPEQPEVAYEAPSTTPEESNLPF